MGDEAGYWAAQGGRAGELEARLAELETRFDTRVLTKCASRGCAEATAIPRAGGQWFCPAHSGPRPVEQVDAWLSEHGTAQPRAMSAVAPQEIARVGTTRVYRPVEQVTTNEWFPLGISPLRHAARPVAQLEQVTAKVRVPCASWGCSACWRGADGPDDGRQWWCPEHQRQAQPFDFAAVPPTPPAVAPTAMLVTYRCATATCPELLLRQHNTAGNVSGPTRCSRCRALGYDGNVPARAIRPGPCCVPGCSGTIAAVGTGLWCGPCSALHAVGVGLASATRHNADAYVLNRCTADGCSTLVGSVSWPGGARCSAHTIAPRAQPPAPAPAHPPAAPTCWNCAGPAPGGGHYPLCHRCGGWPVAGPIREAAPPADAVRQYPPRRATGHGLWAPCERSQSSAVESARGRTIEAYTRPVLWVDDMYEPP